MPAYIIWNDIEKKFCWYSYVKGIIEYTLDIADTMPFESEQAAKAEVRLMCALTGNIPFNYQILAFDN